MLKGILTFYYLKGNTNIVLSQCDNQHNIILKGITTLYYLKGNNNIILS